MRKKMLVVGFFVVLLSACSSSKFYTANEEYPKLNIDGKILVVEILDERKEPPSKEEDIHLPLVSFGGQRIVYYPGMKDDYKEIIRSTIRENIHPNSSNVIKLRIEILEARKTFWATNLYEAEQVNLKVKLIATVNREEIVVLEEGEYLRKTADAKYKKFEKLYRKSIKEITFNALKALKEKRKSY